MAGQLRRGRVVSARVMHWHTTRWSRLLDAAASGALAAAASGALAAEGWSHILVLDRAQASQVEDLGELVRGALASAANSWSASILATIEHGPRATPDSQVETN
ncbi:MAG TPA: hypothetical protein VKG38_08620 [Solirubrobacteraceae bacterium]|nr:hypothetical protein [Solirubrobacteraceae bacterium]